MCENIGAGDHTVKIRTTQCLNTIFAPGNFHTGWTSYSRMHIEEVQQSARLDAGKFKIRCLHIILCLVHSLVSKYPHILRLNSLEPFLQIETAVKQVERQVADQV